MSIRQCRYFDRGVAALSWALLRGVDLVGAIVRLGAFLWRAAPAHSPVLHKAYDGDSVHQCSSIRERVWPPVSLQASLSSAQALSALAARTSLCVIFQAPTQFASVHQLEREASARSTRCGDIKKSRSGIYRGVGEWC